MSDHYKFLQTSMLEIAYLEYGKPDGNPIVLLHGWPDGPLTWKEIVPSLVHEGWRVLVPTIRGFGHTRFLDDGALRSGQVTAIAQDLIDFADAAGLGQFTLVGHDWGGQAVYQVAVNWPNRLHRLVVLSVPYHSPSSMQLLPPAQQRAYWYQWLLQTNQARTVLKKERRAFCRELWETWMAPKQFVESDFERIAPDWDNPDWIDVTLSSYRFRWRNDAGDPRYDALESVRLSLPQIKVPTTLLHGELEGASLPSTTEGEARYFTAAYTRVIVSDAGHFIQREKPKAVVKAILEAS